MVQLLKGKVHVLSRAASEAGTPEALFRHDLVAHIVLSTHLLQRVATAGPLVEKAFHFYT